MYDYSSVLTVNFYIAPVIYPTCHSAGLLLDFGCFLVGLFFFLSLGYHFYHINFIPGTCAKAGIIDKRMDG